MADELEDGTPETTEVAQTDTAAADAVANFFADGDRAAAAEKEAGDGPNVDLNAAIRARDNADQRQELIEAGEVDEHGNEIEKPETEAETEVEKPAAEKGKAETPNPEPTLDPILREAALEAGYTDAQIDRLFKADAEIAETTFARLVIGPGSTRTDPASSQAASAAAPAIDLKIPDALTDDALKKFAEQNGQEVADAIKVRRDSFIGPMQAMQAHLAQTQRAAIANEANATIAALAKDHVAVYGDGTDAKTTVAQQAARYKLAETADQLIAGAKAQGKNLSVSDALKRAHSIVSRDTVKVQARNEITQQVKKRSAAITNKPTKRNPPKANSGEQSDAAAAEVINNFWNERG